MAESDKNGRRRISHYVPDALADRFDEKAALHTALTKQGFFGVVLLVGMRALEEEPGKYWSPALQQLIDLVDGVEEPEVAKGDPE